MDEAEQRGFFAQLGKQKGGKADGIARLCGVPAELADQWVQAKVHVPYHALQLLAHHFGRPLPRIGELRREYQPVSQAQPASREAPKPPPRASAPAKEPRQAKESRRRRQHRSERRPAPAAPQRQETRLPEPSEELAYWVGATLCAARRRESSLVFSAGRRVGQNFAGVWAQRTRELFGVKPGIASADDGKFQEASLPVAGLESFFDRLGIQENPGSASLPRWAWSNAAWKTACLRGMVDACAHFHRQPALSFEDLPPALARPFQKMFESLPMRLTAGPREVIGIWDREGVEAYFKAVGTRNLKLKDQFGAYLRGKGQNASEPQEEVAESEAQEPPKPQKKTVFRRRRTVYRGRPG